MATTTPASTDAAAPAVVAYHTEAQSGEISFEEALEDVKLYAQRHDDKHWVFDGSQDRLALEEFGQLKRAYDLAKVGPDWAQTSAASVETVKQVDEAFSYLASSPTFDLMQKHSTGFKQVHLALALQELANEVVFLAEVTHPAPPVGRPGRKINSLVPKVTFKALRGGLKDAKILKSLKTVHKKVPLLLPPPDYAMPATPAPVPSVPPPVAVPSLQSSETPHGVPNIPVEQVPKEQKDVKEKKEGTDYKALLKSFKKLKSSSKGGHSSKGSSHGGGYHEEAEHEEERHEEESDHESSASSEESSSSSEEEAHEEEYEGGGGDEE